MNENVSNPSIDARALSTPLFDGKIWLKIMGFSTILQVVFSVITIVGLIVHVFALVFFIRVTMPVFLATMGGGHP